MKVAKLPHPPSPSMANSLLPPTTRAHVLVSGTVQGVGYRYSTMNYAKRFGVNGWVRNLDDSRVEAVFEGSTEAVEQMISWCRIGPMGAIVKDVAIEYEEPQGDRKFEIRRY